MHEVSRWPRTFRVKRNTAKLAAILVILLISLEPVLSSGALNSNPLSSSNPLSPHWVPGWGYRDELNASDVDNQNFWTDNAGKILVMSELTNDSLDASRALSFLTRNGLGASHYLPEAAINSSIIASGDYITNRISMLEANYSSSSSGLNPEQLLLGTYYAAQNTLAYLGSDRLVVNNTCCYSFSSSTIFRTQGGFVKRSFFSTPQGSFYTFLNATLDLGNPYVKVTLQVEPLDNAITSSSGDLLYLQVFSSAGQFDNVSLYDASGNYLRDLVYNNGSTSIQNGNLIADSKQESVFTQDSIALSFGAGNASSPAVVDDLEHWYHNPAFDGLSWTGIAYDSPQDSADKLSTPIIAKVYPIDHMDYRLINDTAKYIALDNSKNTTVSPPVSFGFVSYGLALAATSNPGNDSLNALARSYWNYYHSRYASSVYYTPYARAINLLSLAGFQLYGCNSTVEDFARNFIGNSSGASIEEYAWAVAALFRLERCTHSKADISLYDSFVNSFGTSKSNFAIMNSKIRPAVNDLNPSSTFQFGEAATGLMLGGISYNDPVVLEAMDAVYQSNVSGTLLNQPSHGDLANTETIPAYMLSVSLFQNEMKKNTGGYWIAGIENANVTSIDYNNGTLLVSADGNNGTIYISSQNTSGIVLRNINGFETKEVALNSTTVSIESTTTTTVTTCPCSLSDPEACNLSYWFFLILSAVFLTAAAVLVLFRKKLDRPKVPLDLLKARSHRDFDATPSRIQHPMLHIF